MFGSQLLKTKLNIPKRYKSMVDRKRLTDLLDLSLEMKLTLVSAPAGFGKTTLLSGWVGRCKRNVAWLSLDESDNDFIHFIAYLFASLETTLPEIGDKLGGVPSSTQPSQFREFMTGLINTIESSLKVKSGKDSDIPGIVLVLDDYHNIDKNTIHDLVLFLIENLPTKMHLIISTRADPPFPLARLRACGELTEIRQQDLRFSKEEIDTVPNP